MAKPRSSPPPPAPARGTSSAALFGRLAVTTLVVAAIAAMPRIGLPGIDLTGLTEATATASRMDIFGLGVMPFVSAATLVELAALIVPQWSSLRHGGPAGRAKLWRATLVVTVVLCVVQGFSIVKAIELAWFHVGLPTFSAPLAILTMTAGTFLLGFAAQIAGTYGLVGGIGAIFAALPIVNAVTQLRASEKPLGAIGVAFVIVPSAVVVIATVLVLRAPSAPASQDKDAALHVPLPASGIAPLLIGAALLSLPASLSAVAAPIFGAMAAALLRGDAVFRAANVGVVIALGVLLAWAFNAPLRLAALAARADKGERSIGALEGLARARLRSAIPRSLLFLVGLVAVDQLSPSALRQVIGASGIAIATAVVLDMIVEWRARSATADLVSVWPEHRPYAIALARQALGAAGITVHARGEHQRRLLQFIGPYVPIELMVRATDAERAAAILNEALLARADAETAERKAPRREPDSLGSMSTAELGMLAAAAVIAVGAVLMPAWETSPPRTQRAPARPEVVQIIAVDDESNALDPPPTSLPTGASIREESAPLGPGRTEMRRFVRIVPSPGESMEAARVRLVQWAEALPPPAGARVLCGMLFELDDETGTSAPVGWRTYFVKGPAIVDGADVAYAKAQRTGGDPQRPSWAVMLQFHPAGAERFRAFTAANTRRRLAIAVEGKVESSPVIQTEIAGGTVMITMGAGDLEEQSANAKRLESKLLGE